MFTSFSRVEMFINLLLRYSNGCWAERLTMRLTEPPIFLVSISSPFMQSLKSKWFICLILPLSWQNTLAQLRLSITCNPAIVQQVLWPTWQMRFPSLSRSPARSSPAGCTENTQGCFYWGVGGNNRGISGYESKCFLAGSAFHLTLDKDQKAGSWGVTAKQTEKHVRV